MTREATDVLLQVMAKPPPDATGFSAGEAVVDGNPRAKFSRDTPPSHAGAGANQEDGFDK